MPPRIIESHEERKNQIEAYLAKDPPSVPGPISTPSSLTRSHGNLALSYSISSKRERTADEDDINKFQVVVAEEEEEMSCRIPYAGLGPSLQEQFSCVHGTLGYATVTIEAVGLLPVATEAKDPASYFDILILAPVDEIKRV